jgi:hypothetical protein
MFTEPNLQAAIQRRLWSSIPPAARDAYDRANADYRAAIRSVANTAACEDSVSQANVEVKRSAAAVTLADVFARARRPTEVAIRTVGSGDGRTTAFDSNVNALTAALKRVRTRLRKLSELLHHLRFSRRQSRVLPLM